MSLLTFLTEWTYPGPQRSIGTPYQKLYRDPGAELERLINNDTAPVYVSVNPYNDSGDIDCIDRLFFDFDQPGRIRDAWRDAVKLNKRLAELYHAGALTIYSGSKGYHVYVYLKEPYQGTPEQCKAVYAELQNMIIRGDNYPTLDNAVIGDVKRLCRVPYSLHQKTGDRALPVAMNLDTYRLQQGFSQILAYSGLSPEIIAQAHRNTVKPKPTPRHSKKTYTSSKLRPCIEDILNRSSVHDGPHIMRVAAVAEMNADGYTVDQIIDRFRGMNGFNWRRTRYFVEHSLKRGYKPFRCETIQRKGGCVPSCPGYNMGDPPVQRLAKEDQE